MLQNLSIVSLGLRSLQEISGGMVLVHQNPNLCFLQKVPWKAIFRNPRQALFQTHNKPTDQCGKKAGGYRMVGPLLPLEPSSNAQFSWALNGPGKLDWHQ